MSDLHLILAGAAIDDGALADDVAVAMIFPGASPELSFARGREIAQEQIALTAAPRRVTLIVGEQPDHALLAGVLVGCADAGVVPRVRRAIEGASASNAGTAVLPDERGQRS